jgi:hypothetical protein
VLDVEQIPESPTALGRNIAFDAVLWGVPIVSADAMRQAFFRDAGARNGDIVYLSSPADSHFRVPTPNTAARYVYLNFDTRVGPLVLEMPPAIGAGLFGSILDSWQVPLADVGPAGEDAGKGAKFLLLPPHYDGYVPADYYPVRPRTYNGYVALRGIPEDGSEAGARRVVDLVRRLRLYPLALSKDPPPSRHIDMSGKVFDGIVRFDQSFFPSLSRMVNEEPALERDRPFLARLRELSVEKGRPYSPGAAGRALHERAAREAQRWLVQKASTEGARYWMHQRWRSPSAVGCQTGFTFEVGGQLDVESRALFYFVSYAPPKRLGKATFYLMTFVDGDGQRLDGSNTYRLIVPRAVPASQFWATTVYDAETFAFIEGASRVEQSSYDQTLRKNPDGSVELYFCPAPSADPNWLSTAPGRPWLTIFRFYGPREPLFDRSWQLPDIERVHVS